VPSKLTARDVLDELDDDARGPGARFLDFDHGYNYHVDQRLSAYGDGARWVVVIEQLCVNPRHGSLGGIMTLVYYHGNAVVLPPQPGWEDQPVQTLAVVEDGPGGPLFEGREFQRVNLNAVDLRIRGRVVPIRTDPNYYWARNIEVETITHKQVDEMIEQVRRFLPPEHAEAQVKSFEEMRERVGKFELDTWHLARGLVPEHRDLLLATESERRRGVPADLPLLLQIDEWDHPRLLEKELPSSCESFKMIARVLASGDPGKYQPTEPPNTHWSNWPLSGSL